MLEDSHTLWVGAGYKLYRVDLDQHTAALVYDTGDVVISFVQVDERQLFFGGHGFLGGRAGVVWALDLDSKRITWQQKLEDKWWGGYLATPLLVDNEVVIVGTRTALYGLDKAFGTVRWQVKGNWFGTGELLTPILVDGQLLYGVANDFFGGDKTTSDKTIAVVDPRSGAMMRSISMPGKLGAIPAIHGDCLFVKDFQYYRRDDNGKLVWIGELRLNCVDLDSGEIVWSFRGKGVPAASELSFHDGLVLDVFANKLCAIDEQTGVLDWQSVPFEAALRNPEVLEGTGLVAVEIPRAKKVIFLELTTGIAQGEALRDVLSSPIFVGQEAIYGTMDAIVRVDIETGDIVWSAPVDSLYQVFLDD